MLKANTAVIMAFLCAGSFALAEKSDSANGTRQLDQRREQMRERMKKELNLTAEQEKKLEAHRAEHRTEAMKLLMDMKQKREGLKAELEKPKLDMGAVQKLNSELKQVQGNMADHRLAGILAVREILTPDQFKKFMAMGPGGPGGKEGQRGQRGRRGAGAGAQGMGGGGFDPGEMEGPGDSHTP